MMLAASDGETAVIVTGCESAPAGFEACPPDADRAARRRRARSDTRVTCAMSQIPNVRNATLRPLLRAKPLKGGDAELRD